MNKAEKDLTLRLMEFYKEGESVYCYNLDYKGGGEKKLELAIEIPYNTYAHVIEEECYHAKVQTRYNKEKVIKEIGKFKPTQEEMFELAKYMLESGWEIQDTHKCYE